ncbi:MAG: hypothetical protein OIF50_10990, partial [Flavobacteriaceae bacterium]|nr:hypothetical protein [Flavobacteriaceae bacterium]
KELEAAEKKKNAGMAVFTSNPVTEKGAFYFYNTASLGYGKTEFNTRWGERKLEDNWRWSDKSVLTPVDETVIATSPGLKKQQQQVQKDIYNVDYYIGQLPTEQSTIDSLATERNFANYQLALLYKEKFREYDLAVDKLKAVLEGDPEKKLIVPSKYNLFKIYQAQEHAMAIKVREDIIQNHPDSRYAEILQNPEAVLAEGDTKGPDKVYAEIYRKMEQQEYENGVKDIEKAVVLFNGDPIVPKLELLKATALGRLNGLGAYKEALQYVALNFPNDLEGKKAKEIIDNQ